MSKLICVFDNTVAANFADEMEKRSTESALMLPYWNKAEAFVGGLDAVKASREKYLPRFPKEKQDNYDYRLSLAKLTNVFGDIVENLSSKPFEKEIKLVEDDNKNVPDELIEFVENVDGAGNNVTVFSGNTFYNGITYAVDWIFIDYPERDETIRSKADQKKAGVRPFWSHVFGRNILDTDHKMFGRDEKLIYIKIFEPGKPDHIREFFRDDFGVVTFKLWEKSDKPTNGKTQYILIKEDTLTIDEIPLVPFASGRREGRTSYYTQPMKAALDLQENLYRNESGLEYTKTLAAYPLLTGNGVNPPKNADGTPKEIQTGPGTVLFAPMDGNGNHGQWDILEPSAQSMDFLQKDIEKTILQLRELGRQPLTAQSGNLTVITTAVAAGKATSAVRAWALLLKDALENAMVITCKWLNITPEQYDPTIYVFSEWQDGFDDDTKLQSLDADRDRGDISRETLLEEKRRRGVYSDEFSIERENERLLAETPSENETEDE